MKIGLQLKRFDYAGGTPAIGPTLARVAREADDAGFDSIWVMDHFLQIGSVGRPEEPMLEGLTTLGYMAAHSRRARLGLMVGGIHYRHAGLWIKAVTSAVATRVASGDVELWRQILGQNRPSVLQSLEVFEKVLNSFKLALEQQDDAAITELLSTGKRRRDALAD